jgi:predicted membrane GTPase involved in stress response
MQGRAKSELQIQVLRLYREGWKFAVSRPQPLREKLQAMLRGRYEKNRDIPRIKFHQI